LWVCSG